MDRWEESAVETVAVIGTGEMGTRHLQGIVRGARPVRVFAVDPSEEARDLARRRIDEVGEPTTDTQVEIVSTAYRVPDPIDVAIVATTAQHRRAAAENLLDGHAVRALVLEKFLFQSLEDFDAIAALLEIVRTPAWVNCPRRLWPGYRRLRSELTGRGPVDCLVTAGERFGVGTTSVHFLDLASFLSGQLEFDLSGDGLDRRLMNGSRGGIEFTGSLEGGAPDGSSFLYTTEVGRGPSVSVTIKARGLSARVDETARAWVLEIDGNRREDRFSCPFQSDLTGPLVERLLAHGSCELTRFEESAVLHKAILRPLLRHYRAVTGSAAAACPIT